MEMWWAGVQLHPMRQAGYLAVCLVLLFAYNRYDGLRPDATLLGVALDAVEALGLGLVISFGILWLLGRFEQGDVLSTIVGRTVMEAGLVAIGISVGKAQLGARAEEQGMEGEGEEAAHSWVGQLVFGVCGAVLVAASVGPTEEIQQLSDNSPWRLLGLAALSQLLAFVVLYFSNFACSREHAPREGPLDVLVGGALCYVLALGVAAGILFVFGRFDDQSWPAVVNQTVALALPATLGASAGRLLLQYQP
jgi:putative integral membrane protein (TIGR02587 family)